MSASMQAFAVGMLLIVSSTHPQDLAAQELRRWTVLDAVERTQLSQADVGGETIAISPDRRSFYFVSQRADIARNERTFTLHVYEVQRLLTALRRSRDPRFANTRKVSLVTSTGCAAIAASRWVTPNKIAFLGCEGTNVAQVYSYSIEDEVLTTETHEKLGVYAFEMTTGALVYLAKVRQVPFDHRIAPPGRLFPDDYSEYPTRNLVDLLGDNPNVGEFATFVRRGNRHRLVATHPLEGYWTLYKYFIAPDECHAIVIAPAASRAVSSEWRQYAREGTPVYWSQFQLLDLVTGEVTTPVDAPTAEVLYNYGDTLPQTKAIWDRGSRHVLLVNTALPAAAELGSHAVLLEVNTREIRRGPALDTRYEASQRTLDVTWRGSGYPVLVHRSDEVHQFDLKRQKWGASPARRLPRAFPDRVKMGPDQALEVRRDANTPPDIVMFGPGSFERAITDLNPQLRGLLTPAFQTFHWESGGRAWEAGLLLPPEGCSVPCPLAVQIGYWDPDIYAPDSTAGTNFSAQALAAHGAAVLSANLHQANDPKARGVIGEANRMIRAIEDAVLRLTAQSIVDSSRVGLSGFSRSAQYVKVAITRARQRVPWAAAITGDGGDSSYAPYGLYSVGMNISAFQEEIESNYGGPFWLNKSEWVERAPGFNLEHVRTPLLLEPHALGSLVLDWEFYSGLRILKKPVDIAYMPVSEHWLSQPRDIGFSQQMSVDWFLFWLRDYRRPGASPHLYERWDGIRETFPIHKMTHQPPENLNP